VATVTPSPGPAATSTVCARAARALGQRYPAGRVVAALVAATFTLAGCASISPPNTASHAGHDTDSPATHAATGGHPTTNERGTAVGLLATLVVRGRAPMTGYNRDRFGQAWLDADRNGCDTRSDQLRRYLRQIVLRPGTNGCIVASGVLDLRDHGLG